MKEAYELLMKKAAARLDNVAMGRAGAHGSVFRDGWIYSLRNARAWAMSAAFLAQEAGDNAKRLRDQHVWYERQDAADVLNAQIYAALKELEAEESK